MRLVGGWSGDELLCVVHVSGVGPSRRLGPHTVLPLSGPQGVTLLFDVVNLFAFGQVCFLAIETII